VAIGVIETVVGGYIDTNVIYGLYGFKDIIAFVVILLVLLVRPYGLFGTEHIERL
jgi:branched-chain amino acid transport system permease protein